MAELLSPALADVTVTGGGGPICPSARATRVTAVGALRAANDILRFVLELASLVGLGIWGWETGPTGVNVALAIAAPLAAAALWGAFVAPKAPRPTGDPWRLLLEATVFGAGALAFARAGMETIGLVAAVAAAVHLVATFALGQRAPGGHSPFGPPPA
jgi:hypothetical protein